MARGALFAEITFLLATSFVKISVLCFYRRLVKGTCRKVWKYATIVSIWFTASYCTIFIFTLIFACDPVESYWRGFDLQYKRHYHCKDTRLLNPLSGTISVLSDAYSVILPGLMTYDLQTTRRQKIAFNAVLSLGLLVVGAGIARTYYLSQLGRQWDSTWIGFKVHVWAMLEVHISFVRASAPALRVLMRGYLAGFIQRAKSIARSADWSRTGGRNTPSSALMLDGLSFKDVDNVSMSTRGTRNSLDGTRSPGDDDALPRRSVACILPGSTSDIDFIIDTSQQSRLPELSAASVRIVAKPPQAVGPRTLIRTPVHNCCLMDSRSPDFGWVRRSGVASAEARGTFLSTDHGMRPNDKGVGGGR